METIIEGNTAKQFDDTEEYFVEFSYEDLNAIFEELIRHNTEDYMTPVSA